MRKPEMETVGTMNPTLDRPGLGESRVQASDKKISNQQADQAYRNLIWPISPYRAEHTISLAHVLAVPSTVYQPQLKLISRKLIRYSVM